MSATAAPVNNLLSIGQFSQACRLSVKTLRRYANMGLLLPAWTDPSTGYRYYRAVQAADAERIRLLRELDLPLADVREVLATTDPDVTAAILERHERRLEDRISAHELALARLRALQEAPVPAPEVRHTLRSELRALTFRLTTDLAGLGRAIGAIYGRLGRSLALQSARPSGSPFARYHAESFDPDHLDVELGIPTVDPVRDDGDLRSSRVPAGAWVSTLHEGPYERITDAYAGLFAWATERNLQRVGPVMESFVVSPKHADGPGEYRTEILFPVDGTPQRC